MTTTECRKSPPPPPYSGASQGQRKPPSPALSQVSRSTMCSWFQRGWFGSTSRSMNFRKDCRNSSWSSRKSARSTMAAHSDRFRRARKPDWATTLASIVLAGLPCACKRSGEKADDSRTSASVSRLEPAPMKAPMEAPGSAELGPLSVGQWTRYRLEDRGRASLVTHKVIGEESGAFWVEFVTGAADAGTVLALLVHAPDRIDRTRAEIRAAKIRMPNGLLKEIRGAELKPTDAAYRKMVGDLFSPSLRGLPQS